jgi:DNA polymerase (family X)
MSLGKNATNPEIAAAFAQVASVYELQGKDIFHIRAYQNAANSISQLATPLQELWQNDRLDEVPGLGEKFAKYIDELFRTGAIRHFQKVLQTQPAGFYELLDIPGVGPKTAQKISRYLHLSRASTALSQVKTALLHNRITGISEKMSTKLLAAINRPSADTHRLLINEAEHYAEEVMAYLWQSPATLDCAALGSLRRKMPTIGDVDIAVATTDPAALRAHIKKFPQLKKMVSTGNKMTTFLHKSGIQIDIKTQHPDAWGSMLQHDTGSKLHNIQLRTLAKEQHLSLSEYGIKRRNKITPYADETSFYQALGLPYIPPELREGRGEISAAQNHQLPTLVELSDMRGDLHMHAQLDFPSSHDMGAHTVAELIAKAQQLQYEYLGISDHNPKQSGLTAKERFFTVQQRTKTIKEAAARYARQTKKTMPQILIGLEVDILPNGELALEDEALDLLDYTIVSIHSQFTQPRATMTKRILTGLAHPQAKILGHPTGRQLGTRSAMAVDWPTIFRFCAQHHKFLEINASPQRLDLPDELVHMAIEYGVQLVINTDAHAVDQLDFMQYGVWVARRGWCGPEHLLNTKNWPALRRALS